LRMDKCCYHSKNHNFAASDNLHETMKTKILAMALFCTLPAMAQQVTVTRHTQLMKGTESGAYNPVLSADGQMLLYSSENYRGLKIYSFEDGVSQRISDEDMAGFSPTFSADGKNVYYLSQTRENMLTYRTMKQYSFANHTTKALTGKERGMLPPVSLAGGVAVVSDSPLKTFGKVGKTYAYADKSELVVVVNGKERRFSPVKTEHYYMWASLSPDATKVLFYAGGKGAYISDLEGNVIASLGKYVAPCWFGNDYVVAEYSTSDGYQYESSNIVLLKADGSFKKALTAPESMSMNPTASGSAGRIVYNTVDGRMFVMELDVEP